MGKGSGELGPIRLFIFRQRLACLCQHDGGSVGSFRNALHLMNGSSRKRRHRASSAWCPHFAGKPSYPAFALGFSKRRHWRTRSSAFLLPQCQTTVSPRTSNLIPARFDCRLRAASRCDGCCFPARISSSSQAPCAGRGRGVGVDAIRDATTAPAVMRLTQSRRTQQQHRNRVTMASNAMRTSDDDLANRSWSEGSAASAAMGVRWHRTR